MGQWLSAPEPAPRAIDYDDSCKPNTEEFKNLRTYQIMVSSFQKTPDSQGYGKGYGPSHHMGNLRGIINALDYIKSLNVNAIWLTPIFDSSGWFFQESHLSSTGYFTKDYFNVDPHFGTNEDFRELVDEAHKRGLYVFLDGVFGHHGGIKKPSPSGRYPHGHKNPVSYPESLEYYKEVAAYWINEYAIDGWRLDQCYQMYQHEHNYLHEIREVIEYTCAERKKRGEEWGTLGYIVGEHWSSAEEIANQTYAQEGLRSAFDFPGRYFLVQALAQDESGSGGYGVDCLANIFKELKDRQYPDGVFPNMFISNHDLWRFGNLIRSKYEIGPAAEQYWNRHKIAIAALCAYSGPITLYYGDEYGDITEEWYSPEKHNCGKYTASDNCARTDGFIENFNEKQEDLKNFTARLMKLRAENPSMWRGTDSVITFDNEVLFNCKYDHETTNKVIFACNISEEEKTVSYHCGGTTMEEMIGDMVFTTENGIYDVTLPPLTATFFQIDH